MKHNAAEVARGGFTLVEVAVATIIIGISAAVLLTAVAASTRANGSGRELTQGVFLAQEIREWTLRLPFSDPDPADQHNPPGPDGTSPQVYVDDLDDLMDVTYSPPRDGQGLAIADMTGWSEKLTLTWRDPNSIVTTVSPGGSDLIYVKVDITNRGRPILTTGWLVARRQ